MSQARSEQDSAQDILGQLETYEELSERCRRYASLKENVEKERESVQLHIYEKVRREYENNMLALEQDLKEQTDLLQEQLGDLLEKRAELDGLCRKNAELLEEIDFRTRVGEFSKEECKEERSELEERTLSQSQELARLEEILGRYTKVGLLKVDTSSSPAPAPGPEQESEGPQEAADDSPALEPEADEPEPLEPAGDEEGFEILEENPMVDDQEVPVVHCPPNLSPEGSQTRKGGRSTISRPSSNADASEYVTGYLVALEGSRKGERFPMISSNITLGNSPGIDIRLSDSGIANFHARIRYKERKHFLENLDGMGRTFVNGVQAAELVELKDGDVIRLGDIKMQVEYASANTTHPT